MLDITREKEREVKRAQKKAFEKARANEAPEEKTSDKKEAVSKDKLVEKPVTFQKDTVKPKSMRSLAKKFLQRKKPE